MSAHSFVTSIHRDDDEDSQSISHLRARRAIRLDSIPPLPSSDAVADAAEGSVSNNGCVPFGERSANVMANNNNNNHNSMKRKASVTSNSVWSVTARSVALSQPEGKSVSIALTTSKNNSVSRSFMQTADEPKQQQTMTTAMNRRRMEEITDLPREDTVMHFQHTHNDANNDDEENGSSSALRSVSPAPRMAVLETDTPISFDAATQPNNNSMSARSKSNMTSWDKKVQAMRACCDSEAEDGYCSPTPPPRRAFVLSRLPSSQQPFFASTTLSQSGVRDTHPLRDGEKAGDDDDEEEDENSDKMMLGGDLQEIEEKKVSVSPTPAVMTTVTTTTMTTTTTTRVIADVRESTLLVGICDGHEDAVAAMVRDDSMELSIVIHNQQEEEQEEVKVAAPPRMYGAEEGDIDTAALRLSAPASPLMLPGVVEVVAEGEDAGRAAVDDLYGMEDSFSPLPRPVAAPPLSTISPPPCVNRTVAEEVKERPTTITTAAADDGSGENKNSGSSIAPYSMYSHTADDAIDYKPPTAVAANSLAWLQGTSSVLNSLRADDGTAPSSATPKAVSSMLLVGGDTPTPLKKKERKEEDNNNNVTQDSTFVVSPKTVDPSIRESWHAVPPSLPPAPAAAIKVYSFTPPRSPQRQQRANDNNNEEEEEDVTEIALSESPSVIGGRPSARISDEVRQLVERAQMEVRRTRESLLATLAAHKNSTTASTSSSSASHGGEDELEKRSSDVAAAAARQSGLQGKKGREEEYTPKRLRAELPRLAGAIHRRLQGYDTRGHGVLPMETVLRVTFFVLAQHQQQQQQAMMMMGDDAVTPRRRDSVIGPLGGSSYKSNNVCGETPSGASAAMAMRMSSLLSPLTTSASSLRHSGDAVDDQTRASPTRTLERVLSLQSSQAETDALMDCYVALLKAFREVFGERYAFRHLGATNATRQDTPVIIPSSADQTNTSIMTDTSTITTATDIQTRVSPVGQLRRKRADNKAAAVRDLSDIEGPIETAFPRLRQQYSLYSKRMRDAVESDDAEVAAAPALRPPPLDVLVYYRTFTDSLQEL